MALKLFRAAWFLSALIVLVNLLYVYASWPESVIIQEEERVVVDKEWLFYIFLLSFVLINSLVYLFKMFFPEAEDLRSWFHGFIITVNIFLIVTLQALNVYNGNEMINHELVSMYLTGSLVIILVWAAVWPVYLVFQKFFIKEAI